MYTNEEMLASIKKVEANRAANAAYEPARMLSLIHISEPTRPY